MAERLVMDMAIEWEPAEYHDTYRDDLMKMIEEKASGKVKPEPKAGHAPRGAEVIDFASLLERSLGSRSKSGDGGSRRAANDESHAPRRKTAAAKTRRKAAPKSTPGQRRAA